jgi:hypothetical protein
MLLIQNLTDDPKQEQSITLPDGSRLFLSLYYRQSQNGWFYQELSNVTQKFLVKGMRVVNIPNVLRQFKNLINFGLACYTQGNREPTQLQDFSSGASKLYILTQAEVLEYESYLVGGVL